MAINILIVALSMLLMLLVDPVPAFQAAMKTPKSTVEGCNARVEAIWDCELGRLKTDSQTIRFGKLLYLFQDLPAGLDDIEVWIARLCAERSIYGEIVASTFAKKPAKHPLHCYLDPNLLMGLDSEERTDIKAIAAMHRDSCASFYRESFFRTAIERLGVVGRAEWKGEICRARFEQEGDFYHDRFGRKAEEFLAEYIALRQQPDKDEEAFLRIARLHSKVFLRRHQNLGIKVFAQYPELAESRIRDTYKVDLSLKQLREMTPEHYFLLWLRTAERSLMSLDAFEIGAIKHLADGVHIDVVHYGGEPEPRWREEQTWRVVKEEGEWRIKGLPAR